MVARARRIRVQGHRNSGCIHEGLEPRRLLASVSGFVYEDANGNAHRDAGESGQGGWTVYQDLNNNGKWDNGRSQIDTADAPKDIPDPGVVTSSIVVTGLPGTVTDVDVIVDIVHPWTPDITGTLISPLGTRILLFRQLGDLFAHEDYSGTTFDDEAGVRIQDETPPFTGSYQPMQALSGVDGEAMNGTWKLEVRDDFDQDQGWINDWAISFGVGEPEPWTNSDFQGFYEFTDLAAGTYPLRLMQDPFWTQTEPPRNGAQVVTLTASETVTNRNFGVKQGAPPAAEVLGRHVFYNRSLFDGNDAAAGQTDDAAVATNKQALLPGQGPATFANYTSYGRGINGIMVDVSGLASDAVSADDFSFLVGNSDDPTTWSAPAQAPSSVTVRRGAGDNGSDRVTIIWPDNAIKNQWLQVTTLANSDTGLETPDVFYFGNLVGETGNSTTSANVNALDIVGVRRNLLVRSPGIDNAYDFNRDGRINALDMALVKANQGRALTLFSAPAAGAPFSQVPVAATAALKPQRVWDEASEPVLG
jgi:subtilisin-like proprotein convertase family protein